MPTQQFRLSICGLLLRIGNGARFAVWELLCDAPLRPAIKKDRAPVWVPRNGSYYVITCTDFLRSFSIPAEKDSRALRELRTLECLFCKAKVQFIVEEKPEAEGLPSIQSERTA